jgi:hypothetical protein
MANTLLTQEIFEAWLLCLVREATTSMDKLREVFTQAHIVALRDPTTGEVFETPRTIDLRLGQGLSDVQRFVGVAREVADRADRAGLVLITEVKLEDIDYVIALASHVCGFRRMQMAAVMRGSKRAKLSAFVDMPADMLAMEPVASLLQTLEFAPHAA